MGRVFGLLLLLGLAFCGVFGLNRLSASYFDAAAGIRAPENYRRNRHFKASVKKKNGRYYFKYRFKDHRGKLRTWKWNYESARADKTVRSFGLPLSFFRPYRRSSDVKRKRKKLLKKGSFLMRGNSVAPDYNRMIKKALPFTAPLSALTRQYISDRSGSRQETLELVMKFVQDIPYGIPPVKKGGRFLGGVFPVPQTLRNKWGDCDSKVVLTSAILAPFNRYKLVYIYVPGHILLGVEGIPRSYQKFVRFRGRKYILLEAVGPGRFKLGAATLQGRRITRVEKVKLPRVAGNGGGGESRQEKRPDKKPGQGGSNYVLRLYNERGLIKNKKFKIYARAQSDGRTFKRVPSPSSSGEYSFHRSGKRAMVYLRKKKGYGLYLKLSSRKTDLRFVKGRALMIYTKPKQKVILYGLAGRGWSDPGAQYKADKKGVIRLILNPGVYEIIKKGTSRPGKKVRFDYRRRRAPTLRL